MKLLISACLLGLRCRYDGQSKTLPCLEALNERYTLIPICPEVLGGLPVPRPPCEMQGEEVVRQDGTSCTEAFRKGAELSLTLAQAADCKLALLKERSPSCGLGCIYDGSFTGTLRQGNGITAELLSRNGIRVVGESRAEELLEMSTSN